MPQLTPAEVRDRIAAVPDERPMQALRPIDRVKIDAEEFLGLVSQHLIACRDHVNAGRYDRASNSCLQASHRLLDLAVHLAGLRNQPAEDSRCR